MFAVIYQFRTKTGKSDEFIKAWSGLTKLIYNFEGSLGSRLHKESENSYIAYAQWPNKQTWENSGKKLPKKEADYFRKEMKDSCEEINTLYQLQLEEDLLQKNVFSQ